MPRRRKKHIKKVLPGHSTEADPAFVGARDGVCPVVPAPPRNCSTVLIAIEAAQIHQAQPSPVVTEMTRKITAALDA
ncbi:hypothetical protein ACQPZ2_14660 [Nocardia pseudovaccinii]|uniref:hypothetical protein n=1 Tax=Nocardia pseudovaccinii TaxID=189540 RepID=UPI003D8FDA65